MAYKWRDEIVGKRFLCITTVSSSKIKVKKINEWIWRQGIIRASNRPHSQHNDLTVLVEYDGVDWRKREWIKVYDQQFHVFLIEYSIVWTTRREAVAGGENSHWLALNFKLLVDEVGLRESQLKPIEFLDDRQLDFVDYNGLKLYEEGDLTKVAYKSVSHLDQYIRQWTEFQNSQKILLTTPSVLVGYRVKVYRSEGTTQWYTAVIVSYNENTKELTLTDDTVLEERNEDPNLVQMKLIGDGVVESILKGEEVGITPRRRACNQNSRETSLTNNHNNQVNCSNSSSGNSSNSGNLNSNCKKLASSIGSAPQHHPNRVKSSSIGNASAHNHTDSSNGLPINCNNVNSSNTSNEKEVAIKTNKLSTTATTTTTNPTSTGSANGTSTTPTTTSAPTPSSKPSESTVNCIKSVMNSSVTQATTKSEINNNCKPNYQPFELDSSDTPNKKAQPSAQQKENKINHPNTSGRVTSKSSVSSVTNSNNIHQSSTPTSTQSTIKSNSSEVSSSPSLMHLHMTPSQSGSHLPRPPCPPNGDQHSTGPPSSSTSSSNSSSSSASHQQHLQQQLHLQQQQQQQKQQAHHLAPPQGTQTSPASPLDPSTISSMSRPLPGMMSPYNNYNLFMMQQHEMLWPKYPDMRTGIPGTTAPATENSRLMSPYQMNDWKLLQEREMSRRDTVAPKEMKLDDKQIRERYEREKKQRDREAVQQHFEQSLRSLENQKRSGEVSGSVGWSKMGKGSSKGSNSNNNTNQNSNQPPPPPSPIRSSSQQRQSQPPVSSTGPNSRSYIPMSNGVDNTCDIKDEKPNNSINHHPTSRASSNTTSSHHQSNNSNSLVHQDVRLMQQQQQRHSQQSASPSPSKSSRPSAAKLDYRSSESNLSHLTPQQQFNVLSQQQQQQQQQLAHSPNGPQQHPLHLMHPSSWSIPRPSDHPSGKGSQSHHQPPPGHPGGLPLHLQGHHGPGQLNPSQLHLLNNMSEGSKLMAHYDAKMSNLMRENSSSPSLSSSNKKSNTSPVNSSNNSHPHHHNSSRDSNSNNNNSSINSGSRSDHLISSKHGGPIPRANSEMPSGPYGYTPYSYPPPPPRSSGSIKDTLPPHHPPPSLPPPHLAVGKLTSSTPISNPLTSAPNARECFSPITNSLNRPASGPTSSRPPPPAAHSGGSTLEKREPSPLIDRSGTPIGGSRNTGTPLLGRPPSAASSSTKYLSGKVAHQFNSMDRISPLYHNSTSSQPPSSSLPSGQQPAPSSSLSSSSSSHSSSPFSQQSQPPSGVLLMSAPPAHQSSSPGLATSRSNTPQLSSSNITPIVLSSSTVSLSSASPANHPSLTNLSHSSSLSSLNQDQPQNLVKSESKVRNSINSGNNTQSHNLNISSKGQQQHHHQGGPSSGYMKHAPQFKGEDHKLNPSDRYSINGPSMESTKQQQLHHQQQQFTPISSAGVLPGAPGGGLYPHYMKNLSPSRYNLPGGSSSSASVSPHPMNMGYDVSRLSRTSGPGTVPFLTHPSNSFDSQLKGPNDNHGVSGKPSNLSSYKVNNNNNETRMGTETINLDLHQAHSHHSAKGNPSIPFSGNNNNSNNNNKTLTISSASVSTALTITTSPLTSISPTMVKSQANNPSNNGVRLIPPSVLSSNAYLPPGIHPMMSQSNFVSHHSPHSHPHHGQPPPASHLLSLSNNTITPLGLPPNGSIIHGLPVTGDKKLTSISSLNVAHMKDMEYDQYGKRKGLHNKEVHDLKKVKREDEGNNRTNNNYKTGVGGLTVSPTDVGRRSTTSSSPSSLTTNQSSVTIEETKTGLSITERKMVHSNPHHHQDFVFNESPLKESSNIKGSFDTPMTITTTMLPPPVLNTAPSSNPIANASSLTSLTVTPTIVTQSGSTAPSSTKITGPATLVNPVISESPVTTTINRPASTSPVVVTASPVTPTIAVTPAAPSTVNNETSSGPSKFHPKLKKAWLQRHSEAEVESNSNQSTSSSLSVTNTVNNNPNNVAPNTTIFKEEDKMKQPSLSTTSSTGTRPQATQPDLKPQTTNPSNPTKVKHSSVKSDQLSDTSASSSPRGKRQVTHEEKNKKKSRKEPSSDEDGDETSSISDYDFTGDKSNSSVNEKSKSSKSVKKRITSRNTSSKRHKSSGGSNSGSGSENRKDDCKWSKEERERRRRTKEGKINARRGRKPKSSTRSPKESTKMSKESFRDGKESKKKPIRPLSLDRPSTDVLKKTGQPFLQDGTCYDIAPRLPKCRECRMTPNQRNKKMPNIFCRFYAFRKLKYGKTGLLFDQGFSEPQDASDGDLKLWLPPEEPCKDLDMETSKFLIAHVGDQFCDLVRQEQEALDMHLGKDKTITWKRVVQGVREMCDVCETTLFNIHWACHKCGFVICIDCYKARRLGYAKAEENPTRDRDEYQWLLCTNRQPHEQKNLMMTQIIASTALNDVGKLLHVIRKICSIDAYCGCDTDTILGSNGLSLKMDIKALRDRLNSSNGKSTLNGLTKSESKSGLNHKSDNVSKDSENSTLTGFSSESGSSPLSWLADVALSSRKMGSSEAGREGAGDTPEEGQSNGEKGAKGDGDSEECNFSTLRELLIRPTSKKNKNSKVKGKRKKKSKKNSQESKESNENRVNDENDKEDDEEDGEDEDEENNETDEELDEKKEKEEGEDEDEGETTSEEGDELEESRTKKKMKKEEPDQKVSTSLSSSSPKSTSATTTTITSTVTTSSGCETSTDVTTTVTSSSSSTETTLTTSKTTTPSANCNSTSAGGRQNKVASQSTSTTSSSNKGEGTNKPSNNANSSSSSNSRKGVRYSRVFRRKLQEKLAPTRSCDLEETKKLYPEIPHSWLCSGRLLVFEEPKLPENLKLFQDQWKRGQPVLVNSIHKLLDSSLWCPEEFNKSFGDSKNDLVNCKTGLVLPKLPMKKFWDGFENLNKRMKGDDGDFMTLKLKDWPPGDDFSDLLPDHYADLMDCLPLPEYTRRDGCLNLAGRLPNCFVRPDLGPKMYNAYGSALSYDKGTTNLHLDISDAVNTMVYVGVPKGGTKSEDYHEMALKALDEGGCDDVMKKRCRDKSNKLGALWHIYEAKDANSIRDLLFKVAKERGVPSKSHFDPIHDQSWYLDATLRDRLKTEYGVEGYAIGQCLGDAIFIPAGAPHQVRNLQSCIKVAGDFVSPENVSECFNLTQEFRHLSDSHINHEDKLQIKNIIYHAIKDALASLQSRIVEISKSNHSHHHHHHHHHKSNSVNHKITTTTNSSSSSTTSAKAH